MTAILIVDDTQEHLDALADSVTQYLQAEGVTVLKWMPADGDDASAKFEEYFSTNEIKLVITDYDLTKNGRLGLFGSTIVDWCQRRHVPVGNFSRGQPKMLPSEPSLFEIRVPTRPEVAARYVAEVFRGFVQIRASLEAAWDTFDDLRSPAAVLAKLLNAPTEANQFSLYTTRYGAINSALLDDVMSAVSPNQNQTRALRIGLLTYICGHLLLNAILKYPGPILNKAALAALCAADRQEEERLGDLFQEQKYGGPFRDLDSFYWLSKVSEVINTHAATITPTLNTQDNGEFNRTVVEIMLNATLARDVRCTRCNGKNGGFLCPFTHRVVCLQGNCSIGTNSWVPQGARLCRIEKDFYDEWSPILGM
ncbi:MAG: hypothetical protein HY273_07745 [Gammaproteobacteria bacterium]|nr:hypothetical protein [Gammaproteobacteria bacterium]